MPTAAEHAIPSLRGQKTIGILCSQEQYERVVDDPKQFRKLLDQLIETAPELFPPEIRRGYRMKDLYHSRKTGERPSLSVEDGGTPSIGSEVGLYCTSPGVEKSYDSVSAFPL